MIKAYEEGMEMDEVKEKIRASTSYSNFSFNTYGF